MVVADTCRCGAVATLPQAGAGYRLNQRYIRSICPGSFQVSLPPDQPTGPAMVVPPSMSVPAPVDVTDRIAQQVATLDVLGELPLAEHADAYQRVHAELQRALAEIDGA
jgi:hypothetical protein